MPIYVDVITRLEERSATESAKRIEKTFADAGKSAGTEFSRNMTAEMDRASKAMDDIGRSMTQGFGAHGLAAGREFGGAFGSQLSRSIPGISGFTSAMAGYETAAGKVGAVAGRALGLAFTTAAAGLIGAAGYTLFKGFERYKSIDAATNRLQNLNRVLESTGKATIDVDQAMKVVNDTVEGTPYALDKAFGIATRALSSNTGDLKRFMTDVSDAAGFAGADIDNIGDAFLKIANTGKVSMEELTNQLRDLPIQSWLAETLGKSGDEIAKMISKGQVGLEDLLKTVEEHASGFAKSAGDTIEGTIGNLQTAFARLGANFLGAVFGKPTDDVNDLKTALDAFTDRINGLGAWVTAHQDDIKNFFESAIAVATTLGDILGGIADTLGGWENLIVVAGGAFVAWKTIGVLSTVAELATSLGGVSTTLVGIPALASAAGAAIATISAPTALGHEAAKKTTGEDIPWYAPVQVGFDYLRHPSQFWDGMSDDNKRRMRPSEHPAPDPDKPPAHNFYKDWYPAQAADPTAPAGAPIVAPPGDSGDGKKGKGAKGPRLPEAPVLPYDPSALPPGMPGMPRTAAIMSAESSWIEAQHKLAEKKARLQQLESTNAATDQDLIKARNDVAKAERDQQQADMRLKEAQESQAKKFTKTMKGVAGDLGDIGAQLDSDFGISDGLAGIAENITKFLAGLAFAPMMGTLSAISQANPIQGGHGLLGMLGAQNMAAQGIYTNVASSGGYGYGPSALGPAGLQMMPGTAMPGYYGSPGTAKAGESDRDFAHRVMKPYFENMGLTVGDHAADQYGEHQNGALDIMVDSLAEGQQVLQQVLSDPNVYGAIFDNKVYGYGQGPAPQPYSAGFTGNPTQDHQDHVHVWYKPGGSNNISPSAASPAVPLPSASYYGPSYSPGPAYSPYVAPSPTYGPSPGPTIGPSPGPTPTTAPFPNYGGGDAFTGPAAPGFTTGTAPVAGPGGEGFQGASGLPMQAAMMATQGLDLLAPGTSQAAQVGMQLANRAIGYGGQVAGIGVGGLLETLLPSGSNLANFGNSWVGRLASGFAGARPALPNMAGQQAPPMQGGQDGQQPGQAQQQGDTNITVNNNRMTEDGQGRDIASHLQAMYAGPGR
ncbi:tape measure protein [Mycolicibacillus trivialis]